MTEECDERNDKESHGFGFGKNPQPEDPACGSQAAKKKEGHDVSCPYKTVMGN